MTKHINKNIFSRSFSPKLWQTFILLLLASNLMAQTGTLKGRVYDALNNEALPFVNVVISNTTTGAVTDIDGNFIITGVKPGYVTLSVSFVGYKTYITPELLVSNAKAVEIDIALEQTDQSLDEVVINASPFVKTEESPVSLRSIGVKEIETNPGSNRDISKVIQSFPGVAFTPSNRNDVIVRGGAPSEARYYLDGVEIPNINHFATQGASGGSNGIINSDFIREVNFYAGAFPANRGNALSAVFDFKQIDGNDEKFKFRGTVGASETSFTLDGPLSDKTTVIASVRRSYLQFLFKIIGLPFEPTYNDFQFKSRTRIDAKNEITIIGLGAYDVNKLNTSIENPTEDQRYILNFLPVSKQWNYTLGAVYKHYSENSYQTIVLSRNMLENSAYKYLNNDESSETNKLLEYKSWEIENKLRVEQTTRIGNYKINFGVNGEFAKYTNDTYQKIFVANNLKTVEYSSLLDFFKYGAFGQVSHEFMDNTLTLSLGFRMDGNTYSESMANPFSPRFSASYKLTDDLSINFNTGRYYQTPAYTTLGFRENNKFVNKENNLKYITSDHIIGGFEYRLGETSIFTVESFGKFYQNYPVSITDKISLANRPADFGVVGDEAVTSTGGGRAYGFEVYNQNRFPNKLNLIFSYTFVRSEFENDDESFSPAAWDNKHLLIVTASKDFGKGWNAGVKWRFAGGLPYTPYDLEKSSLRAAWDVRNQPYLDYNNVNGERFAAFHQLDLRIDKSFFLRKTTLRFYIDVQNAYNFKSESQDRVTNSDVNGAVQIDPNDPTKYVLRSIANDGSGTVLPTIGIVIDF